MIVAFAVANVSAQVYPQGLISYWKLDETSGTIALDALGVNNGQLINGPMWTTGKVGNALHFDGTLDYVEMSDAKYPQGNTDFAFEAWMKAPAGGSTNDRLISIGKEGPNEGIWVGEQAANPNYIRIGIMWGTECESSSIVFDDLWHHIVGTYDQNNLRIYIDGNLENTCSFSNLNMLGSKITLGQHETKYPHTYFNGKMDEVAIYNRALTTDEIQYHYLNGLKGLGYFENDSNINHPPNASPEGAGTFQINTSVVLGGSVSDFDGDMLLYQWLEGANDLFSGSIQAVAGGIPYNLNLLSINNLSLGTHTLTLRVDDGNNPAVSGSITVNIIDTVAPTLAPAPDKTILWPPNHQMVTVTILTNASDNSGRPVTLSAAVTSNEPQNGLGDGDLSLDWTTPVINNGMITLQLRAERSGKGPGRIYTIAVTATDEANNSSTAQVKVSVPHDEGNKNNNNKGK